MNRRVEYRGRTYRCLKDAWRASDRRVTYSAVRGRIARGESVEAALSTPGCRGRVLLPRGGFRILFDYWRNSDGQVTFSEYLHRVKHGIDKELALAAH